jgi:DNA mismatch repair ATPase MutS
MGYSHNEENDSLVYLYQLQDGACPESFGILVAKLAGLPADVVSRAKAKSKSFQQTLNDNK